MAFEFDGGSLPGHEGMGSQEARSEYNCPYQDRNNAATILKQIQNIQFSQLLVLEVERNRIESVECLSQVDMPVMQGLRLCKCSLI